MDSVADVMAIVVIIIVPVIGIALFWLVHILPEKIAEKRHHPQADAIQVLCLLSLVFGGMLWPLAWLWAYSKPVLHQLAYGRDKHDEYYEKHEAAAVAGPEASAEAGTAAAAVSATAQDDLAVLRRELDALESRGELSGSTQVIRERLASLERRTANEAAVVAER
jgi:hypothetical protein